MEISLAFGSFLVVLGACTLAARGRRTILLVTDGLEAGGEPGFLRRLAS